MKSAFPYSKRVRQRGFSQRCRRAEVQQQRGSPQKHDARHRPRRNIRLKRLQVDVRDGDREDLFAAHFEQINDGSAIETRLRDRILDLVIRAHMFAPEMGVAVHDERAATLCEHFTLNHGSRMAVSHERPGQQIFYPMDAVPVHGRIAEQHAQSSISRVPHVDRANFANEVAVHRKVACRSWRTDGVLPCLAKRGLGDRVAANEAINDPLVLRVPAFDDDVVDCRRKPRITNQREPECIALVVAVIAFAQCDDAMGAERVEDGRDRIGGKSRRRRRLCRS